MLSLRGQGFIFSGKNLAIFLMVTYPVLAPCFQRTKDRRGSRQRASVSLAMGFRGPNVLRLAVAGERPDRRRITAGSATGIRQAAARTGAS